MNLTAWARHQGIHPRTAYRWWRNGTLPVPAHRVGPRTIVVEAEMARPGGVALYARVSSHDQRVDLERQLGRLVAWAAERDLEVTRTVSEVGSGMNGAAPAATAAGGRQRDDDRGGASRSAGASGYGVHRGGPVGAGRRLMVVDRSEVTDDLVGDMTEVLTGLCARLYGRRSARTRAARALRCAEREPSAGPLPVERA